MQTETTALMEAALRGYDAKENQHKHVDMEVVRAIVAEIGKLDSRLGKVKPGEPIFVLRAQDLTADRFVLDWANEAHVHGLSKDKEEHARQIAYAMRRWPNRKYAD